MINYVMSPNLPECRVSAVICGTDDELIIDFFNKLNIIVYPNVKNTRIDPAVSSHADMAVLHLGGKYILVDRRQTKLAKLLKDEGFDVNFTDNCIEGDYPNDVRLNFTFAGDKLIGNFKYADENLKSFAGKYNLLNVRQGYCKCSLLVLNENAVITDDESIYREMLKNSVDCLLISKGDIALTGHEYGFIGGASGKISKSDVVFFGDVKKHRDFKSIDEFLKKHGCNYICTDDSVLRDIGGIIPIIEKQHNKN